MTQKQYRMLFHADSRKDFDKAFVALEAGTFEPVDVGSTAHSLPLDIKAGGIPAALTYTHNFDPAEVKAWSIPHVIKKTENVSVNGVDTPTEFSWRVTKRTPVVMNRVSYLELEIEGLGREVFVRDSGVVMRPGPGAVIHDQHGYGWPMVETPAVNDPDTGERVSDPVLLPGIWVVVETPGNDAEKGWRGDDLAGFFLVGSENGTPETVELHGMTMQQHTLLDQDSNPFQIRLVMPESVPDKYKVHGKIRDLLPLT